MGFGGIKNGAGDLAEKVKQLRQASEVADKASSEKLNSQVRESSSGVRTSQNSETRGENSQVRTGNEQQPQTNREGSEKKATPDQARLTENHSAFDRTSDAAKKFSTMRNGNLPQRDQTQQKQNLGQRVQINRNPEQQQNAPRTRPQGEQQQSPVVVTRNVPEEGTKPQVQVRPENQEQAKKTQQESVLVRGDNLESLTENAVPRVIVPTDAQGTNAESKENSEKTENKGSKKKGENAVTYARGAGRKLAQLTGDRSMETFANLTGGEPDWEITADVQLDPESEVFTGTASGVIRIANPDDPESETALMASRILDHEVRQLQESRTSIENVGEMKEQFEGIAADIRLPELVRNDARRASVHGIYGGLIG